MKPSPALRLLVPLFIVGALGAQATVFEGTPGAIGDVLVFPAPGSVHSRPLELQDIQLLPIDAAGRTAFTQFQPGQARLIADVPGASRLLLPQGKGCLYRYRRDTLNGARFGFFVVGHDGRARALASFEGTGPLGTDDPVPDPVGVSAQGEAFLVATTLAAGGDVHEVRLDGTSSLVTASLAPIDVLPQGLILLPRWGAALTSSGPVRFVRGPNQAVLVPLRPKSASGSLGQNVGAPPRAPRFSYWGDGLVASADGSTIGVVAGTSAATAHVFTFRATGEAVCVNDTPAPIQGPGFATQSGPNLALSPNGARAAWKTLDALGGESFSRRIPTTATPPEVQITADANFTDTLNDTGVLAFFDPDSVVLLVGEPNGAGGIEKGDFYRATFPAGGGALQLTNLTNTSGDVIAPFDEKGDLETADGLYQIPGELGIVFFVPGSSGQGFLMRLDAVSGTVDVLRTGVAHLDFVERVGAGFVAGILHDQPAQRELVFVPFDHALDATSHGLFAGTTTFGASTGNAQGLFGSIIGITGGEQLGRLQLPAGGATMQYPAPLVYGPTLGFDPSGNLLATVQLGSSTFHFSWLASGKSAVYKTSGAPGMVLPGR
jgi:hypothetical protein